MCDLKRQGWFRPSGGFVAVRQFWAVLVGMVLLLMAGLVVVPKAQAAGLSPGQTLAAGQSLTSAGGGYRLVMQTDGNLVLYGPAGARWSTGTARSGADRAVMQRDGNLVVYRGSTAVWAAGTSGAAAAGSLSVQEDGNLVVYAGNGAVWSSMGGRTGRLGDTQPTGVPLTTSQYLTSPNGSHRTVMQGDGNFVGYTGSSPFWVSGTRGSGGRMIVQDDGNLMVQPGGSGAWQADTAGHGPMSGVVLQNDGNLVLHTVGNGPAWSTRTGPTGRSGNTLSGGQVLTAGMFLSSPDGAHRAVMHSDGNVVVRGPSGVLWQSGTRGSGVRAVFQSDGNLVVHAGSSPLWDAGVSGFGGDRLVLQNDGNLVVYAGTRALWSSRGGMAPQVQPLNLLIPAGTCGAGGEDEAWNHERPIQLVNGSGEAFDADLEGAGIFAARHLGNVDVNGDGINEIVLAVDCSGTPLYLCCASRASVMTFVVALDVTGPAPTRVGGTIVPGLHDGEQYDIVEAGLAGAGVVTTQRAVYQDTWPTRQVTYRYDDGQWRSN